MATRDIEPLELVMWDNAAALGPRMGTAPVCLQVIVVMVMVMVMVMAGPGSHLICLLNNPKHLIFFLQCLKPVDGSYMCPECGWPMCDEKCAKGRSHEIECSTLKAATKKVI